MMYFPNWLKWLVGLVLVWGLAYSSPNLLSSEEWEEWFEGLPSIFPHNKIGLGLDLQGGAYMVLEAGLDEIVSRRLDNTTDDIRRALRKEKIGYRDLSSYQDVSSGGVSFRIISDDVEVAVSEVRIALSELLREGLELQQQGSEIKISFNSDQLSQLKTQALEQTIEVVRRRIDALGTREALIQRQGKDRILVQLPGLDDPEYIKLLIGKTAQLNFHLVNNQASSGVGTRVLLDRDGIPYQVRRRVEVSGEYLANATPTFENGSPVVSFEFDGAGARAFGNVTARNVGSTLAVVLDDEVISAPVIREAITGGRGIISGDFTSQEAFDLALLLRAGALPAPLEVIEERTVGPSLGADSVTLGKWASAIGLVLVAVVMLLGYGVQGLFAILALSVNLILVVALLSVIGATLTLPGVVGIILTVGMAVDANVLILERIYEEIKKALPLYQSIENGFSRAFSAIVDANVTTLIAGLMLFAFASGPVKGFAVTLCIGIISSMFSSIMVTRLLMLMWLRRNPKAQLTV